MGRTKISELTEIGSVVSTDFIEVSHYSTPNYFSRRISIENFKNTMGVPPHNISDHLDTLATGTQLNMLVSGGNSDTLHTHDTSHRIQDHTDAGGKFNEGGYFNGTNAFLSFPDNIDWYFGTNNFTIDFWVMLDSLNGYQSFVSQYQDSTHFWNLYFYNNQLNISFFNGVEVGGYNCTFTAVVGRWYHIAFVRNSATALIFVNGESQILLEISPFSTNDVGDVNAPLIIGNNTNSGQYLNGIIDEFRITKGTARWISNFSVPTSSYTTDSYTKLLLHFDNSFYDSSITGHTITNTNVIFSTVKLGTGNAEFFNINNSNLVIPDHSDWFFNDNFTIDFWIRFTTIPPITSISFLNLYQDSQNNWAFYLDTSTNRLMLTFKCSNVDVGTFWSSWTPNTETWYHVVVERNNSSCLMFINGTIQTVTQTTAFGSITDISGSLYVGKFGDNSGTLLSANLDELRISKGIARWTSTFTPPITEYTSDSYTKLLLHFSNNVLDNSLSVPDITNNNVTYKTTEFPTGAAIFNGTSSSLTLVDDPDWFLDVNDFTIDFWINFNNISTLQEIFSQRNDDNNFIDLQFDGVTKDINFRAMTSSTYVSYITYNWSTVQIDTWYHVAVIRNGSVANIYINGQPVGTETTPISTNQLPDLTNALRIGQINSTNWLDAYIDEFRWSQGVARWTSIFTPPSSQYTSDSYTKLLLHLNGDVVDSGVNTHTVSDSNITYDTTKYGTGCFVFNGTSSYISALDIVDYELGTSNFTIEFWAYSDVSGGTIIKMADSTYGLEIIDNAGTIQTSISSNGTSFDIANGVSMGSQAGSSWIHYALVRNGNTWYTFRNGTQISTFSDSSSINTPVGNLVIGGRSSSSYWNGLLDEIRISVGIARWTSNFTPPTSPYTTDSYTKLLLHADRDIIDDCIVPHVITNNNVIFNNNTIKFGSACLQFNPLLNSHLSVEDHPDWYFHINDFTIDLWINFNSLSNEMQIMSQYFDVNNYFKFEYQNTGTPMLAWYWYDSGVCKGRFHTLVSLSLSTWYHLAIVKLGNSSYFFLNGINQPVIIDTTFTILPDLSSPLWIGSCFTVPGTGVAFDGFMDEIRISKIARWVFNFSPAVTEYTTDENTVLLLHSDENIADSGTTGTGKMVANINTVIQANLTGPKLNNLVNGTNADTLHHHTFLPHSIADHIDSPTVTGLDLTTLTDGSNADSLHVHTLPNHTIASHSDTAATGTQLDTLTAGAGSVADSLHKHDVVASHTVASHDTTATGANLNTLTNTSNADTLHKHSYTNLENIPPVGNGVVTGTVLSFPVRTPPTGFLECDGSSKSKVTYPGLYDFLKDGGVTAIYGEDTNTFVLPDYRGIFHRGWDHGAGLDPDAASRTNRGDGTTGDNVGTKQSDDFKSHKHDIGTTDLPVTGAGANTSRLTGVTTASTTYTGGNETRPRNINVMYCIKY